MTTQNILCYHTYRQQVANAWQTLHSLCDASQTHHAGNHTTIQIRLQHMRSPAVVTEIKYHRIKNNNTCCGYRIKHITQSLIHYHIYCLSTFYMVVFFICIYAVGLNKRIYVSVTYVLCLYGCSWVILLTTCGYKTIVSTIEHTFVFDMKTPQVFIYDTQQHDITTASHSQNSFICVIRWFLSIEYINIPPWM